MTYYACYHRPTGEYWKNDPHSSCPLLFTKPEDFKTRYDFYMEREPKFWERDGAYYIKYDDIDGKQYISIPFEEMEIIEWHSCDDFIYVIPIDCQYEIGGTAVVNVIKIPQIKMGEDAQGYPCAIKNEEDEYEYEFQNFIQIRLIEGYVNFGWTTPHDEGYSMEYYAVEKDVDELNQPAWLIECTTGGRDCDGQIEYYTYLKSKGGFNKEFEHRWEKENRRATSDEIEQALEYYRSPMTQSNHKKNYNRDHSAEAMGY